MFFVWSLCFIYVICSFYVYLDPARFQYRMVFVLFDSNMTGAISVGGTADSSGAPLVFSMPRVARYLAFFLVLCHHCSSFVLVICLFF
jgi:hypothetical protein